jgi:sugar phosphate isomerase/epimerase
MKLTVMTLGCPDWDLETILRNVKSYGYAGIDFRGLADTLDITKLPAFTTDLAATARRIQDAGLEVSGISSSLTVCNPEKRADNLEEARRTVPVALGLGAKNVRVFGGGPADTLGHEAAAKIGVECMQQVLDIPGARQLSWNFETHDQWISSRHIKLLLDAIADPAFGALWDMGHPLRVLGEAPAATMAALGPRLRYTHVKDAVHAANHPLALTEKDGQKTWRYVEPGAGELQLAEGIKLLRQAGYDGWLCFEHEKRWIKDLPEPEVIFPQFIAWARKVLA